MRDPYEVLGIQRSASKDEIKAAYRKLAKQYHPDMHADNPLKDLAQEKFIEVQEAYDQLTNVSSSSYNSSSYSSSSSYNAGANSHSSSSDSTFQTVRQYANSGNYRQAIYILNGIKTKNAEWYFLMGVCSVNIGSTAQGLQLVRTACNMEPNNTEYSSYLNQIINMQSAYQTRTYNYGRGGNSDLNCCTQLICADCLCEMMGGDLIPCC